MSKAELLLNKINKAFAYMRNNKIDEAINEFLNALTMTGEKSVASDIYYQLALCHIYIKKYDEAIINLKLARGNCDDWVAEDKLGIYTLLVHACKLQGDQNGLQEAYEDIVGSEGAGVDIYRDIYNEAAAYLIDIYRNEKRYADAFKLADEAIDNYADNKKILVKKIELLSCVDDIENLFDLGLDYVRRYGYEFAVYANLGRAYGLYEMAEEAYKYISYAYKQIPIEVKEQISMDSAAFNMLETLMSGWSYHESCDKEFFLELLNRRYKISAAFEKNTEFNTELGFFKRLKIGYLSPELCNHPVGEFVTPVMVNANNRHSENVCYSLVAPNKLDNPISKYIMESASKWHDLHDKNDDELEAFVLDDKPDIMLELMSVTANTMLPLYARRLAPLQVSWIGFPVSTGVKTIDYVITDRCVDPPGAEEFYTEKLLYMPDTFLCHLPTYDRDVGNVPCIKNKFTTFGCLNNCNKITDRMLRNWNKILCAVEDSRLLLKSSYYDNRKILELLKERMVKIGFDMERVVFEGVSDFGPYLEKYNEIDILLDTFPFNGATTTFDAFFMGTPLIALVGETHASRVSLGMLTHVGLEDLAVFTDEDYISKAIELAADIDRLVKIKSTLRDTKMNSKLSDANAFRNEYEHIMRRIWIDYCKEKRRHAVYGGLDISELLDGLVNGAVYICKLVEDDSDVIIDEEILDEYISLQRVFIRRLSKLWAGDGEKANMLDTGRSIASLVYELKKMHNSDISKLLNSNKKFILGNF